MHVSSCYLSSFKNKNTSDYNLIFFESSKAASAITAPSIIKITMKMSPRLTPSVLAAGRVDSPAGTVIMASNVVSNPTGVVDVGSIVVDMMVVVGIVVVTVVVGSIVVEVVEEVAEIVIVVEVVLTVPHTAMFTVVSALR